jgi:hypothetical protein
VPDPADCASESCNAAICIPPVVDDDVPDVRIVPENRRSFGRREHIYPAALRQLGDERCCEDNVPEKARL